MNRTDSLEVIKGIGSKTAGIFRQVGVSNLADLLEYYPRDYDTIGEITDIADLQPETQAVVCGEITQPLSVRYVRGLTIAQTKLKDDTGSLTVIWFNQPYLKNAFAKGRFYVFVGRVKKKGNQMCLEQPSILEYSKYETVVNTLQPVYSLTKGLTNRMIQNAVRQVLSDSEIVQEYLPDKVRERFNLAGLPFALEQIHFPKDIHELLLARNRLVFDEFFLYLLGLRGMKSTLEEQKNQFVISPKQQVDTLIGTLEFTLTKAQTLVWKEILADLQKDTSMTRLLQGDVGSGKTIIAELALITVALNNYQCVLMAPTEVLARQHFEDLEQRLKQADISLETAFLCGSTTAKERKNIYENLKNGEIKILIGTHAVYQDPVVFQNLALVITDEQHRFGVKQREQLTGKGAAPHVLVMSATPIPRTLAVILYGDLNLSVIDELPANRLAIKNCVVDTSYRKKAYELMMKQIEQGHQVYIICSMVEESTEIDAENVLEYSSILKNIFPKHVNIEYLHGKMKPKEKQDIMDHFIAGKTQILISTTVIEVGINVPNATVMLVENSERFGLAQLHQLRGRVGRGKAQSYCIFMYDNVGRHIKERLEVLNQSNDGFEIAKKDMKLRGPGDLFGVRQSGLLGFRLGDVCKDTGMLEAASVTVEAILQDDPELLKPEHLPVKQRLEEYTKTEERRINL